MMDNVGIEFKPSELVAVRVYDRYTDQTIAILSLETLMEWDHRLECLIAWLEGAQAAYFTYPIAPVKLTPAAPAAESATDDR